MESLRAKDASDAVRLRMIRSRNPCGIDYFKVSVRAAQRMQAATSFR